MVNVLKNTFENICYVFDMFVLQFYISKCYVLANMYDEMSFILRGKIRKKILFELTKPTTPSTLAEKLETHRSSISRALISMQEKGLVDCLTPNEKLGRLYCLSDLGKKVLLELKND